jgi:hypothetical protein
MIICFNYSPGGPWIRLNVDVRAFFTAFFWNSLFGTTFGICTSMFIFEAIDVYTVSVIDERDKLLKHNKKKTMDKKTQRYTVQT